VQCSPALVLLEVLLTLLDLLNGLIHQFYGSFAVPAFIRGSPLQFLFGLLEMTNCRTHVWFLTSHLAILGEQAHSC